MFKRFLVFLFTLVAILGITLKSNAADVYQTIDIVSFDYPHIDYYPRTLHINEGDTLHLTIRNDRRMDIRFFLPAFNLDQIILKNDVAQIDLCVVNPIAPVMTFIISSVDGENIPGYILTDDFNVPKICQAPRAFDTSFLNDIINYNKDYCYPEKTAPNYVAPQPVKKPVRGYW